MKMTSPTDEVLIGLIFFPRQTLTNIEHRAISKIGTTKTGRSVIR